MSTRRVGDVGRLAKPVWFQHGALWEIPACVPRNTQLIMFMTRESNVNQMAKREARSEALLVYSVGKSARSGSIYLFYFFA